VRLDSSGIYEYFFTIRDVILTKRIGLNLIRGVILTVTLRFSKYRVRKHDMILLVSESSL